VTKQWRVNLRYSCSELSPLSQATDPIGTTETLGNRTRLLIAIDWVVAAILALLYEEHGNITKCR
jgi:hypothetical protein